MVALTVLAVLSGVPLYWLSSQFRTQTRSAGDKVNS
jgi:hypothetical protein